MAEERVTLRGFTKLHTKLVAYGEEIKSIRDKGQAATVTLAERPLFRGMFMTLQSWFEKFNTKWDECEEYSEVHSRDPRFPEPDDENLRKEVKQAYYEAHSFHEQINIIRAASCFPSSPSNTSQPVLSSRRSLPPINLPKFDGNPEEWPEFKQLFTSLVDEDPSLPFIEKFHHLLSSLRGPARDTLRYIPVSEANYAQAWGALVKKYDNKRLLACIYLNKIVNAKPASEPVTAQGLNRYLTTVGEAIVSLKAMHIRDLTDFILLELAMRGLQTSVKEEFELKHAQEPFPTFKQLKTFLEDKSYALARAHGLQDGKATKKNPNIPKVLAKEHSLFTQEARNSSQASQPPSIESDFTCFICKRPHTILSCYKYLAATPAKRLDLLKKFKGCRNCLHPKHSTAECKSTIGCKTCQKRHHSTLHLTKREESSPSSAVVPVESTPAPPTSSAPTDTTNLHASDPARSHVVLATARVLVKTNQGKYLPVRAVLDSASQRSFITTSCARELGYKPKPFGCTMVGLNQSPLTSIEGKLKLFIKGTVAESILPVEALAVPSITSDLPQFPIPPSICQLYSSYTLADPNYWKPSPINLLLGADVFMDVVSGSPRTVEPSAPKLVSSIFGHVIMGPYKSPSTQPPEISLVVTSDYTEPELSSLIQRFWELEEVPHSKTTSPEEALCEEHFLRTHTRTEEGRYVVSLPFKEDTVPDLSASKAAALSRFYNLERKLIRNPSLQAEYKDFMRDYLENGRMELANGASKHVVPHHPVVRPSSTSTKVRVVFDYSCHTNSTPSLNSLLHTGPKLQNDLSDILLTFRCYKYAFTCDIVKMFPSILLSQEDRSYQHIFWRPDPSATLQLFQINILSFGLSCAPYLALRVLKQLALDEGSNHLSEAARVLNSEVYVDDIVTGEHTIEKAIKLQQELITLLSRGCFQLSKWAATHAELIPQPTESPNKPYVIAPDEGSAVKLLGLEWHPSLDQFAYRSQRKDHIFTKRGILSAIASIFDPIGFLAPVIFTAKRLLQLIFKMQRDSNLPAGWDDEVPPCIKSQWTMFLDQLPAISDIKIPRYLETSPSTKCQLIGFSDGSERGFAAAVFLRVDGPKPKVSLIRAKTRVAPLKNLTIPRMELCGALLLAEVSSSVLQVLQRTINITSVWHFTDSTTVLQWLGIPPDRLKVFVANRRNKILELTSSSSWFHVSSEDNAADVASRGILPHELQHHHLWWTGPAWLTSDPSTWPTQSSLPSVPALDQVPETKPISITLGVLESNDWSQNYIQRFSSWPRLVRVTAYLRRMLPTTRRSHHQSSVISADEFEDAARCLIKVDQNHHFKSGLATDKALQSLSPFIDDRGVIRVGGRIANSSHSIDMKHPIVIHPSSHLALLLVSYYHEKYYHPGPRLLTALLRSRYWIPGSRNLVRSRVHACVKCRRYSAKPLTPQMGQLPAARLIAGRCFAHTGVDFAGPFLVRESLRRKAAVSKAYLCLYVCMASKAVHLEALTGLHTDQFLASFHRFASRRGLPSHVYSDCGTTFVGASNQLKEILRWWHQKETQDNIMSASTDMGITWHFNPPYSPHFGGLWEAGVKSVKSHLYKIMSHVPFTFEELSTTFARIEATLNSRPLCPLSESVDDTNFLTPAHLLVGHSLVAVPEKDLTLTKENRLTRWELVNSRVQHFWRRWQVEYLHGLQQRTKWRSPTEQPTIGDLVIIKEDNSPPSSWPVGRIQKVHPGGDGVTRVVTLNTPRGTYKRSVHRLIRLLPLQA